MSKSFSVLILAAGMIAISSMSSHASPSNLKERYVPVSIYGGERDGHKFVRSLQVGNDAFEFFSCKGFPQEVFSRCTPLLGESVTITRSQILELASDNVNYAWAAGFANGITIF